MEADLQAHVAFFLSGKANTPNLEAIDQLNLRPALLAGYRDPDPKEARAAYAVGSA